MSDSPAFLLRRNKEIKTFARSQTATSQQQKAACGPLCVRRDFVWADTTMRGGGARGPGLLAAWGPFREDGVGC